MCVVSTTVKTLKSKNIFWQNTGYVLQTTDLCLKIMKAKTFRHRHQSDIYQKFNPTGLYDQKYSKPSSETCKFNIKESNETSEIVSKSSSECTVDIDTDRIFMSVVMVTF